MKFTAEYESGKTFGTDGRTSDSEHMYLASVSKSPGGKVKVKYDFARTICQFAGKSGQ